MDDIIFFIATYVIATLSISIYLSVSYYYVKKHNVSYGSSDTDIATLIFGLIILLIPMVNLTYPVFISKSILSGELEEEIINMK